MRKLKIVFFICFIFMIGAFAYNKYVKASFFDIEVERIRALNSIWNTTFSTRDPAPLIRILAEDVQMASAGGKWQKPSGTENFLKALFKNRPDITWKNEPTEIKVNPTWKTAYESGNWIESWTEADGKTTLNGKYFMLWKQHEGAWLLQAAIFTPMSCSGSSYCSKK